MEVLRVIQPYSSVRLNNHIIGEITYTNNFYYNAKTLIVLYKYFEKIQYTLLVKLQKHFSNLILREISCGKIVYWNVWRFLLWHIRRKLKRLSTSSLFIK